MEKLSKEDLTLCERFIFTIMKDKYGKIKNPTLKEILGDAVKDIALFLYNKGQLTKKEYIEYTSH